MPGASVAKIGSRCLNHVCLAAYHHAVASLESPHATAGANINVVDLLRRKFLCATNVVNVIRIPAVDQDVPCFEEGQKISNGLVHYCRGNH